jgi:hypothetical protein
MLKRQRKVQIVQDVQAVQIVEEQDSRSEMLATCNQSQKNISKLKEEKEMKNKIVRLVGGSLLATVAVTGCGSMNSQSGMQGHSMHGSMTGAKEAATAAADLRVNLNALLGEHMLIAAVATSHALGGREIPFKGAVAGLDANSGDIAKAIGSVYGPDAEKAFLPLWQKHIGFVVDYTTGVAAKDKAKQDKAVKDLIGYDDFGAFLSSANPNLPKGTVAELVKGHILTLKDVVDAQAAKEWPKVYSNLRLAAGHMAMIADPLGMAIAKQFPERFAQR